MDYSFFDDELQGRFTATLEDLGVTWTVHADPMAGTTIRTADDLSDAMLDQIEGAYEALFEEQAELAESREGWVTRRVAGVQVSLPDGSRRTVALDARLSNRLLEHFSADEVAELVRAIADSLSRNYDGPLCRFPADDA